MSAATFRLSNTMNETVTNSGKKRQPVDVTRITIRKLHALLLRLDTGEPFAVLRRKYSPCFPSTRRGEPLPRPSFADRAVSRPTRPRRECARMPSLGLSVRPHPVSLSAPPSLAENTRTPSSVLNLPQKLLFRLSHRVTGYYVIELPSTISSVLYPADLETQSDAPCISPGSIRPGFNQTQSEPGVARNRGPTGTGYRGKAQREGGARSRARGRGSAPRPQSVRRAHSPRTRARKVGTTRRGAEPPVKMYDEINEPAGYTLEGAMPECRVAIATSQPRAHEIKIHSTVQQYKLFSAVAPTHTPEPRALRPPARPFRSGKKAACSSVALPFASRAHALTPRARDPPHSCFSGAPLHT